MAISASGTLWRAVRIIAIADIVMTLDNVIAIAAAAETAAMRFDMAHAGVIKPTLIIFGLATSIPLIIAGSALLMALLDRYPILVWAGAALLGWVAGDIMMKDEGLQLDRSGCFGGAALLGGGSRRGIRRRRRPPDTPHAAQRAAGSPARDRSQPT